MPYWSKFHGVPVLFLNRKDCTTCTHFRRPLLRQKCKELAAELKEKYVKGEMEWRACGFTDDGVYIKGSIAVVDICSC
jgi:hypothetical protein